MVSDIMSMGDVYVHSPGGNKQQLGTIFVYLLSVEAQHFKWFGHTSVCF